MRGTKKSLIAWVLALVMVLTMIPTDTVSAAPAKMRLKDFLAYTSSGELYELAAVADEGGRISALFEGEKTYRGIKVGSTVSAVKKKYGSATVKKYTGKDNFGKYLKQYGAYWGIDTTGWKTYLDYTYTESKTLEHRLRFCFDKNNKVIKILYIQNYKKIKLSKNKVTDVKLNFESPSGSKITTKKINGKKVYILPKDATITYTGTDKALPGYIYLYNTKGKLAGYSTMNIVFADYGMDSGTSVTQALSDTCFKYATDLNKLKNYVYFSKSTDVTKLGKYNYFQICIIDNDYVGGYDIPRNYYFKFQ